MAEVRLMTEEDIPAALSVWREVGLSEGSQSLYTFRSFDPRGFYVALLDDGEVVGTCAAVVNNPDLACVGLYAVKPAHQGKKIGIKVWKRAMEHVADTNLFLNSVPEHLETYRDRAGFVHTSPHQTVVCETSRVEVEQLPIQVEGVEIRAVDDDYEEAVIDYDRRVAGYDRRVLVRSLVRESNSVALVALKGREVGGYGCLKADIGGLTMVGPLYADCPEIAEVLLRRMVETFPAAGEKGLIMMAIDANPASLRLADKLQLTRKFVVPRIYTKRVVEARDYGKVYGQCNINFCLV
ncbi:uncharacterized protein [Centruroides vittatus]|uniref:uncharacterized protein n=1 Tax=Centruroides vittatus TaxID=120091 RepID=UPI003510684A